MELRQLRIENLRALECVDFAPAPRWNLFLGPNGAGKTSLLEAVFLLSHGRSFRHGARDALVREGASGYAVFAEVSTASNLHRVGIARSGPRTEARVSGQAVPAAELLRHVAVLCFEPGSHELISGGAEERRQFVDWGVFHVEHDFLPVWRRYQRVLKQRNAALRTAVRDTDLDVWDSELAHAAVALTRMRRRYFEALQPLLLTSLRDLLDALGEPTLSFSDGCDPDRPLQETLAIRRDRDRARGHTTAGPHRADFSLGFERARRREHLSRGQEKLCAFACLLAQARLFRNGRGEWPIFCLDDLASEVDSVNRQKILSAAHASGAQILATGTTEPEGFSRLQAPARRFHVEQGHLEALL